MDLIGLQVLAFVIDLALDSMFWLALTVCVLVITWKIARHRVK